MNDYVVTWQEYDMLVRGLVGQIKARNIGCQSIVALGRGAYPLATMLSHLLGDLPIEPVQVSSYQDREKGAVQSKPFSCSRLATPMLVVDDLVDTGDTMNTCVKHIRRHDKKHFTVVLFKKEGTVFEPDFYGKAVPKDQWIKFPYES